MLNRTKNRLYLETTSCTCFFLHLPQFRWAKHRQISGGAYLTTFNYLTMLRKEEAHLPFLISLSLWQQKLKELHFTSCNHYKNKKKIGLWEKDKDRKSAGIKKECFTACSSQVLHYMLSCSGGIQCRMTSMIRCHRLSRFTSQQEVTVWNSLTQKHPHEPLHVCQVFNWVFFKFRVLTVDTSHTAHTFGKHWGY